MGVEERGVGRKGHERQRRADAVICPDYIVWRNMPFPERREDIDQHMSNRFDLQNLSMIMGARSNGINSPEN